MYRNQKLLEACRQLPCQLCEAEDGTVVAAHSNQLLDGKGKGIKASDFRVAALCFHCHMDLDQGNKLTKEQRREFWEMAHRKTIGELFERGFVTCK
jgi:predicted GNAT superfamily acetyltransferase